MNGVIEWTIFIALSAVVVFSAAGMILTMSMYRAGLALMASFVALAGLFILLDADLLAAIQVMMNVGGMLVMVLFMVLVMTDPGGEMMWGMKRDMHMPGLGAFSMHMPRGKPPAEEEAPQEKMVTAWACPMHPEVQQDQAGNCPKCGMQLLSAHDRASSQTQDEQHMHNAAMAVPSPADMGGHHGHEMSHAMHEDDGMVNGMSDGEQSVSPPQTTSDHAHMMDASGHDGQNMDMANHDMNMSGMTPRQNYQMMVDMAMSTSQLPWAIALGIASALLLSVLIVKTPWPISLSGPTQDATSAVGQLLLSRYMIGFEGAAFLILAGIAGAVILAKRERPTGPQQAEHTNAAEARAANRTDSEGQVYTCPMHPEVRQAQPGHCPKCGMSLIAVEHKGSAPRQNTQGEHA